MRIETLAVHAGRKIDPVTGEVAPAIHVSTTFQRGAAGDYPTGFSYSREGNPNRQALETCLAAMEGGEEALCFSSGMAVFSALVQSLAPGDHILAPEELYYGVKVIMREVFPKWPVEIDYLDTTVPQLVRDAVRPSTRLIWLETPSNPRLRITDLAAIAEIGRKANAITVCDSTFATPVLQRPLEHGIDMVMHSTTKYIGGHSDAVGGALVRKYENYLFERARKTLYYGGAAPSPIDCWLLLRGLETLPWRVRAQCANARQVVEWLLRHPEVERVHYPGLPDHPGHEIARRQMSDFGGMVSFELRGGRARAVDIAARVRVFTRATSLGSTHSLVEHRASIEGRHTKTPQSLLRLSIGLEHAADLIDDLAQALG